MAQGFNRLYLVVDRRLRGWPTLFLRTALAFDQDNGAVMSRSIAYYALFSIFPLLLVLMSVFGSVLDIDQATKVILELVARYLPSAVDLVEQNLGQAFEAQSTVGILALLGLVWSASGVFTAMYRSVNRAWNNPKAQLFWTEKLFGLAVVMVVGLVLLATTLYSTFVDVLRNWQKSYFGSESLVGPRGEQLSDWLSLLIPPLVSAVTFIILYRTIPRNRVTWRDVWLGGLIAGLSWEAGRRLYTWYLSNFARYSLIYGSVGAIIGFLLWSYLSAMILLLGAEFTAQHTAWRRAGRPVESRPPGEWINCWSKETSLEA
ncbi:MAG: YihY/virulence factor BrkB family protein [Anaerolineae bacterium]|jgi:membrane protein